MATFSPRHNHPYSETTVHRHLHLTSRSNQATNPVVFHIRTRPYARPIASHTTCSNAQIHILQRNIIARQQGGATHSSGASILRTGSHIACEIHESDIRDLHFGSAGEGPVIARVLTDVRPNAGVGHLEVFEANVLHDAPRRWSVRRR